MLKRGLEICRAHPVLAAAVAGAVVGAVNSILLEAGGLWHGGSAGVLSLFFPHDGARAGQADAMETALLLLIEFAGNVLGFALLFAVPVALFVGIRRMLGGEKRAASPEERP